MIENSKQISYPFSAIIGQDDFKLALILNTIDTSLGGVLAIGDKGTGKTTLIRSLTALVNTEDRIPFVNLPIGVSEDRILGHINLEKLINEKKEIINVGLLGKAHLGFLYIDEINLLNDYLMDILLDASASGYYNLEREGMSKQIDSRFCLIGSMNPEEGDLRPQLKDRFGLSVNIKTITDSNLREQIIENRINFDDNPKQFSEKYASEQHQLGDKIKNAKAHLSKVTLQKSNYKLAADLALKNQVEGHRADILLIKTARAYASYLGDVKVDPFHLEKIAHLELNHRSNITEPPNNQNENPQDDSDQKQDDTDQNLMSNDIFVPIIPENVTKTWNQKNEYASKAEHQNQLNTNLSEHKSVDNRKTVGQYLATTKFDVKHKHQTNKKQSHLIFLLDSSGSMLKDKVIAYAKGLVQKFTTEVKGRPIFSLVSVYNDDAELIHDSSTDFVSLVTKLENLKTGGKTNVIPAFKIIKNLTNQSKDISHELIIITDGKFNTASKNSFNDAVVACQTYCKSIHKIRVVDAEKGIVKLEQAKKFASKIKAKYEPLLH